MFRTEKELVSEITRTLSDPVGARSLFDKKLKRKIFEELDLGYGIPDVVVVQYKNKKSFSKRKNFLNYFDISILDLIERESRVSFEDIVLLTRSAESKVVQALAALEGEKLIVCREGKYFSYEKYGDALEDSIAIEAKLKNWKRALQQAYRYKWFSKRSYVILPSGNVNPALNQLELFKRYEVGLASMDAKNGLEVHYKPLENSPYSERMSKLLNEHLFLNLSAE